MHFLAITLFEFEQFLRIVLWIALPMVMLTIMVTAYVHHRKRSRRSGGEIPALLSLDQDGFPEVLAKLHPTEKELEAEGETVYQGLLWMKKKYEQDRELADEKYGRLKEGFNKLEEKYLAAIAAAPVTTTMPAARSPSTATLPQSDDRVEEIGQASSGDRLGDLQGQLGDLQGRYVQALQLLDERQTTIGRLQQQLQQGSRRSEALTSRLESGNRMLLKIRQELDRLSGEEWLPEELSEGSQQEQKLEEPVQQHPLRLEPVA